MRRNTTISTQQRAVAEREAWNDFKPKLEALQTIEDAKLLMREIVGPDTPGRRYCSNLSVLIEGWVVPGGANRTELELYIQFIQRITDSGQIGTSVGTKVIEDINSNMLEHLPE